jgi:hypothetical protein
MTLTRMQVTVSCESPCSAKMRSNLGLCPEVTVGPSSVTGVDLMEGEAAGSEEAVDDAPLQEATASTTAAINGAEMTASHFPSFIGIPTRTIVGT